MGKKKLKEKNAFDKTITTYYCQNIFRTEFVSPFKWAVCRELI